MFGLVSDDRSASLLHESGTTVGKAHPVILLDVTWILLALVLPVLETEQNQD